MERQYFAHIKGQQMGPMALTELRQQALSESTLIWYEGLSGWVAASTLDELRDLFVKKSADPPPQNSPSLPGAGASAPSAIPSYEMRIPDWPSNRILAQEIAKYHRNTLIFMVATIVVALLSVVLVGLAGFIFPQEGPDVGVFLAVCAVITAIVLFIVNFCRFHYRCWAVANARSGDHETSPGTAVGLLFIPLFNLYWMFRSYHGLSKRLSETIRPMDYNPLYRPNPGTALAMCILNLLTWIPILGTICALVYLVLWFIVMAENKKAAMHLADPTYTQG